MSLERECFLGNHLSGLPHSPATPHRGPSSAGRLGDRVTTFRRLGTVWQPGALFDATSEVQRLGDRGAPPAHGGSCCPRIGPTPDAPPHPAVAGRNQSLLNWHRSFRLCWMKQPFSADAIKRAGGWYAWTGKITTLAIGAVFVAGGVVSLASPFGLVFVAVGALMMVFGYRRLPD